MTEENKLIEAAWDYAVSHELQEKDETAMLAIGRIFLAGAHYAIKQLNKK